MISTLLLDLDETLLENPNETFLPTYFRQLTAYLGLAAPPELLGPAIQIAMAAMIANDDPARTLRQVFDEHFYPRLGLGPGDLSGPIAEFYRKEHPALAPLTRPRPEAREVIKWAAASGLKVCLATNPLFPLTAIEQRLDWAGIGRHEFEFALVPSYEIMHFGKPRPEYYGELLALLDERPGGALMVGDDWRRDMEPAAAAGLNTYWVAPAEAAVSPNGVQPAGRGSLRDFLSWARDERGLEALVPAARSASALMAGLAGNLGAMHTLAESVTDWKRKPAPGEWSLTETLCHLRDVEVEVNLPRLHRLASEVEPFVSAADTDPWAVARRYQEQDGRVALQQLADARRATLSYLHTLPPEFWSRPARHSILGRTTPAELISFTLEHDRIHLAQIRAFTAWRAG